MTTIDDDTILQNLKDAWEEWKAPHWRSWHPTDDRNAAKRAWAVALGSKWRGSSAERMARLLELLPLAIEQAATHPGFSSARTTLWSILRSAEGLERIAGGVYGTTEADEIEQYRLQVLRLRLPEATLILVENEARRRGVLVSQLVAEVVEEAAVGW